MLLRVGGVGLAGGSWRQSLAFARVTNTQLSEDHQHSARREVPQRQPTVFFVQIAAPFWADHLPLPPPWGVTLALRKASIGPDLRIA